MDSPSGLRRLSVRNADNLFLSRAYVSLPSDRANPAWPLFHSQGNCLDQYPRCVVLHQKGVVVPLAAGLEVRACPSAQCDYVPWETSRSVT